MSNMLNHILWYFFKDKISNILTLLIVIRGRFYYCSQGMCRGLHQVSQEQKEKQILEMHYKLLKAH